MYPRYAGECNKFQCTEVPKPPELLKVKVRLYIKGVKLINWMVVKRSYLTQGSYAIIIEQLKGPYSAASSSMDERKSRKTPVY